MNIFAYTENDSAPAYMSLNSNNGDVPVLSVRSRGEERASNISMNSDYLRGLRNALTLHLMKHDEDRYMAFSTALEFLKVGRRAARGGWNGRGMWVCLGAGSVALPADQFWNKHTRAFAEENGGTATVQPYLIMKNAQGMIQMGWSPTQSDMLADDWFVLEDDESVQRQQDIAAYKTILNGDTSSSGAQENPTASDPA